MELFKLFGRVMVDVMDAINDLIKVEESSKKAGKGLADVDKSASDASEKTSKYAELLERWGGKIAAAFSVAAIEKFAEKLWGISDAVAAQGDQIDKASQKIGVSSKFYQEWSYILQRNGASIDTVGESIFELSEKVGKGDEGVAMAFEALGISMAEMMTATPEEIFESAVFGLMNVESATERAKLSTQLFGDKAKQLGPLLNSDVDSVNSLKEEVNNLGGVMSDTLIAESAEYEDAVTDLKTAWQGFKNDLAENTIPGMIDVVNGFTQMLTGDFIPGLESAGKGIVDFFDGVGKTIDEKLGTNFFATGEKGLISQGYGMDLYNKFSSGQSEHRSGKFAVGLPFVPRDNYPSLLHYGERVLTRQEAEEYDSGRGSVGGFNQTVNISTVAQSPAQTAAAIRAAFETARWSV